ncbi:MAG: hypothetical protein RMK18_03715 [Armatimonadota bacterium]|nr:hypothetical protein [Armatimonadota bacterium]MCX7778233.1 hypothetical protein [Armatimonadota bacterium]MDW8024956.1 hypothetical protein [Armatimonadota bacterium]
MCPSNAINGMKSRNAQTLLGMLISLIIIALLIGTFYIGFSKVKRVEEEQRKAETTLGKVMEKGKGVECLNNLQQLRQLITMYQIDHGSNPTSLKDLHTPPGITLTCPVTGAAYFYDPQSGKVVCPQHPKY